MIHCEDVDPAVSETLRGVAFETRDEFIRFRNWFPGGDGHDFYVLSWTRVGSPRRPRLKKSSPTASSATSLQQTPP
jgi:hypothetical protein